MTGFVGTWISRQPSLGGRCCGLLIGQGDSAHSDALSCRLRIWNGGRDGCHTRSSDFLDLPASLILLPQNIALVMAEIPHHRGADRVQLRVELHGEELEGTYDAGGAAGAIALLRATGNRPEDDVALAPIGVQEDATEVTDDTATAGEVV